MTYSRMSRFLSGTDELPQTTDKRICTVIEHASWHTIHWLINSLYSDFKDPDSLHRRKTHPPLPVANVCKYTINF